MIEPIKKQDLPCYRQIDERVIEAFNNLIQQNWDGKRAVVYQKDVKIEIKHTFNIVNDDTHAIVISRLFQNKQFDVEPLYRQCGFKVTYDKPGYCEDYDAFFTFE